MTILEQVVTQSQLISQVITTYAVTPLLIFFVGLAISAILRNLTRAGLHAIQADMRFGTSLPFSLTKTAANSVFALGAILSTGFALASVDIFQLVLARIAFFLSWLGLLAAALAATDGIRNLFAKNTAKQQYEVGSIYQSHGLSGVVKKHTYTHLVIFTTQAERVPLPYLTAVQAKK